jgi:glycosyltransferase involved in cell wall biosynthesis
MMTSERIAPNRKPRVVIDASSLMCGPSFRGISRTTLELVRALESLDASPVEVHLFGQRLRRERLQKYGFTSAVHYLPLPRWRFLDWTRSVLPSVELLTRYDLLHIPHNYSPVRCPQRTVVTLHDAMCAVCPEPHLHQPSDWREFLELAHGCRLIITCSQHSKKDLVSAGQLHPDKVRVIPWGYDNKVFHPPDDIDRVRAELRQRFQLDQPYFLSVSCNIGRKNSPALLAEFLKLAQDGCGHRLVMVWRTPPASVQALLEGHLHGDQVHLLPFVTDRDLWLLYCGATALLFPSQYEGFGLPVLEAMACGTPVVTCQASSLPEVGGDAAVYIEPGNNDALGKAMETCLNHGYDMASLRRRGLEQAARFSWERTARETLQVYVDALTMA